MGVINHLLIGLIPIAILVVTSECSHNFTQVGDTKLLINLETKNFLEAEQWCNDLDSHLIEFWTYKEWKDVCITSFTLI